MPPTKPGERVRPRWSRRKFLRRLCVGLVAAPPLTGWYAWRWEPHWIEFVRRDLPIADLPADLVGAVLVQLSDLHIGPRVDDDYVRNVFARVRELAPEFVVVTGDWISYVNASQLAQLERLLADLPMGRAATLGVLGNHDYGQGWSMLDVADAICARAAARGVVMLRNGGQRVAGLQFLGLDDFWSPRFSPREVLAHHGGDGATIVLCHNPDVADEEVWGPFGGWILSGHTHGGQCRPPFLPPPLLPVRNWRYTAGEFAVGGGRRLYINRGVGHLQRVRFNVRPEATIFRLVRARNEAASAAG